MAESKVQRRTRGGFIVMKAQYRGRCSKGCSKCHGSHTIRIGKRFYWNPHSRVSKCYCCGASQNEEDVRYATERLRARAQNDLEQTDLDVELTPLNQSLTRRDVVVRWF
jgi:hypothetical protein